MSESLATGMTAVPHFTVAFEESERGWWIPRCSCGAKGEAYPTAEDACDALMEHAYQCGYADASAASNQERGPDV